MANITGVISEQLTLKMFKCSELEYISNEEKIVAKVSLHICLSSVTNATPLNSVMIFARSERY